MQNLVIVLSFLLITAGAGIFLSFNDVQAPSQALQDLAKYSGYNVVYGETVTVGEGHARSWVHTDRLGLPISVGVSISQTVFKSLPSAQGQIELRMPQSISGFDFKSVIVEWQPHNASRSALHPNAHFNVFFKLDDLQARRFNDTSTVDASLVSTTDVRAEAYRMINTTNVQGDVWGGVAFPKAHERLIGSFVYGTRNGNVSFIGQTISTIFLASTPSFSDTIVPSQALIQSGVAPLSYAIRYDHFMDAVHVSLDNLSLR